MQIQHYKIQKKEKKKKKNKKIFLLVDFACVTLEKNLFLLHVT